MAAAFVKRLRVRALAAFFRQEVGWHDQEVNSSAALCTRLSTDCDDVKRVSYFNQFRIIYLIKVKLFCFSVACPYANCFCIPSFKYTSIWVNCWFSCYLGTDDRGMDNDNYSWTDDSWYYLSNWTKF